MSLPNNQNMVEKRLIYLKRRSLKDFKFYEDFHEFFTFMEEMISKRYAKEAMTNAPDSRTWYLPYYGVYHPHKSSILRVVFDCSSKSKERSVNKELLPGPNVANKLVGLLTKFKENKMGFND